MARKSGVKFRVDARTLRGFKQKLGIAGTGIAKCTKQAVVEVCEDILIDATKMVPIDTGALANSADFKITQGKKGYNAQIGYGIGARNPINKRTGKPASSYATAVHEGLGKPLNNGQPKFFEQALLMHESELSTKAGDSIRQYLSQSTVIAKDDVSDKDDSKESERKSLIASRQNESFTIQVDGKYLPFPVPKGMIYKKGGRWFLNKDTYKQEPDRRRKTVKKYKSTSRTAEGIRTKELSRYKGSSKSAPVKTNAKKPSVSKKKAKKPTKAYKSRAERAREKKVDDFIQEARDKYKGTKKKQRKAGDTTSSVKSTPRTSKNRPSTSEAVKGTRTTPNKKKVERKKFIGDLAHETALDEAMQYMIDEREEEKRKEREERERDRRS